jgi:hypothetical protein
MLTVSRPRSSLPACRPARSLFEDTAALRRGGNFATLVRKSYYSRPAPTRTLVLTPRTRLSRLANLGALGLILANLCSPE